MLYVPPLEYSILGAGDFSALSVGRQAGRQQLSASVEICESCTDGERAPVKGSDVFECTCVMCVFILKSRIWFRGSKKVASVRGRGRGAPFLGVVLMSFIADGDVRQPCGWCCPAGHGRSMRAGAHVSVD